MKKFLVLVLFFASVSQAATSGGPWNRFFQDAKFPSQVMTERQYWATPSVSTAYLLKNDAAILSTGVTTISSFDLDTPDVPRNVTLTPNGINNNGGTAVVTGTNFWGKTITESFTMASAQSTATTGNSAFKTVTSVTFPAASTTGATLDIGVGSKLGMKACTDSAGKYVFSAFDSAFETTRGTMAADNDEVEKNTFTPNGTMNGAKPVELYYLQNYRCWNGLN